MICLIWVKLRLLTHISQAKARELIRERSLKEQIYVLKKAKKIRFYLILTSEISSQKL